MKLRARRRGANHHRATLTDHDVFLMRCLHFTDGLSFRVIAVKFDVSVSTAYKAIVGDTWAHVAVPRSLKAV